ncbi:MULTISPECIES: pirin family protein [Acinetobacter]|jgi:redox-sensitive bicupin YhaK (pirin superfamily)|uniref:Pirin family protein n=1 Tax=Acinetobacter chengduensis TaxID=2420890 RepID=A0ABX9TXF3_9GAMM|nr:MULTISPECIES: pirin-like bicupin family protein [Acinetobacter]MBI1450708.1 pirin family protein [Acinetobacter sp. FL51]RKG40792.1 pirin family protein [Acinetobacter sp. WCHAc060007]RLL22828.1 pirin family protein [Acinetobacter chengduensis]
MNAFLHPSENRGHVKMGWLESKHSFSFGNWYNPDYMGVSALRVINDDLIDGHQGFGQHPHDNMEILTCVLKGTITHKDSMGNHGGITAGEWQLMSAGTGVRHSEMNQGDEQVHLLQIWIIPNERDAEPTYQQIKCDPREQPDQWHLIVGPNADAPMHIRQNAEVKTAVISKGKRLPIEATQHVNYVHVIEGKVQIAEHTVDAGGAIAFLENSEIVALEDTQVIWFDLPEKVA